MKFRKLRIAWSVVWGILCLLLIVLWVRSYWWSDIASGRIGSIGSSQGSLDGCLWEDHPSFSTAITSVSLDELPPGGNNPAPSTGLYSFDFYRGPEGLILKIPHWTLALVTAGLAIAPWLRWRFSLRTLLIATTLVAVVLGLIVWASSSQ